MKLLKRLVGYIIGLLGKPKALPKSESKPQPRPEYDVSGMHCIFAKCMNCTVRLDDGAFFDCGMAVCLTCHVNDGAMLHTGTK